MFVLRLPFSPLFFSSQTGVEELRNDLTTIHNLVHYFVFILHSDSDDDDDNNKNKNNTNKQMIHGWRLFGDIMHAIGVVLFLVIVGVKGNGSGVSLKSQVLYLLVFVARYADLLTSFYSWYNTLMKLFFFSSTLGIVLILRHVEPAKSTYSPSQDSYQHWNLVTYAGIFAMLIHLIGSGVVDIKGGSGQEFEVHLEHYSWMSYFWTFSIVLEPLAMIPQLYIFLKNRLLNMEIRAAIFFVGSYRLFYLFFWIFRARSVTNGSVRHHYLLYICSGLQVATYLDFFIYHFK